MFILILILLIVMAATGGLVLALKIALGVALGLFLAVALIGALIAWQIRRALLGRSQRWRRVRGSSVEVLDREPWRNDR